MRTACFYGIIKILWQKGESFYNMNAGEILNSTYEIKEQISSGGGGTIYKAYHKRLQKEVVLKKIHQSTGRNEDEKEILKNIKHSYLPQVFDFLDAEDGVFYGHRL